MKRTKSDPPQARKPYTPPATQNRILEEHLNGRSNRQIAKMIGLDRGTVSRTLSLPEMVEIIEEQRSRLFEEASPKVVSVFLRALDSDDLRIAAPVAMKLGDRMGILGKGIEVPQPERDRQLVQDAVLGQIKRVAMIKAVRYGTDLDDSVIEELRFAKKVLEAYEARHPGAAVAPPRH